METSAKYVSLGPADYRKRVSNTVRVSPAQVYGGVFHQGGPPAGSGNGTRSESSVRERGHIICTSLQQGNWVLQPVFHSSKEGWGIASHFRSSSSERFRHAAQFQDVTLRKIVPQIRFEDWFFTIDLKDAYFHISVLPYQDLRFAFGGRVYQYRVLPFSLALTLCTKCVDAALAPLGLQSFRIMNYIDDWLILAQSHQLAVRHRDVVLAHMKELRLQLNAKKSVLSQLQRTTFLGVARDSTSIKARLSTARIESILLVVKRINLGQSLTVKQFQRLLGIWQQHPT